MDLLLVALAGFFGGMLNAVAGGGSFLTLPVLIYIGVPPVSANATGTAALLPGYIASAWRFRHDIELPVGLNSRSIILVAVVGGCLGAITLLLTNEQLFAVLIPWLILLATVAFIITPWFLKQRAINKNKNSPQSSPISKAKTYINALILFTVCIYGGYFNGGLGIILLAALGLIGQTNLQGMNGLKNVISVVLTIVAVIVYALGNTIVVEHLLLLGGMAMIGGYFGAAISYRLSQNVMRAIIVLIGCSMSIAFFMK